MKKQFRFIAVASATFFGFCAGCGKPGYVSEAENLCKSFQSIDQRRGVYKWATNQINEYTTSGITRPGRNGIVNAPDWLNEIFPGSLRPGATLVLATNSQNDCVRIEWGTGRGVWGLLLGGTNCVPTEHQDILYYHRCQPGVYTFVNRTDD